MKKLDMDDVQKYVEGHIAEFHEKRLKSLDKMNLPAAETAGYLAALF